MKKNNAKVEVKKVWLNEEQGMLSSCLQLRPKVDKNGEFIKGRLLEDGRFKKDPKGQDLEHEPIPGQVELDENDPRVLAYLEKRAIKRKDKHPTDTGEN